MISGRKIFFFCIFFLLFSSRAFFHYYPVFKDMRDFLRTVYLEEDDQWGSSYAYLYSFFHKQEIEEFFWGGQSKVFSVDHQFRRWVKKGEWAEIARYEKEHNLPEYTLRTLVAKAEQSFIANEKNVESNKNYFEKNFGDRVALLGGFASYTIAFFDLGLVAYTLRNIHFVKRTGGMSYRYQLLTRVLSYHWYLWFKKKLDLTYFKLRKVRVLLRNKKDDLDNVTDNDSIIVTEYLKDCIDLHDGRAIFLDSFARALRGDSLSLQFLRDVILGFYLFGLWDVNQGNFVLVPYNGSWQLVALDSELAFCGKEFYCFSQEVPWNYSDGKALYKSGVGAVVNFANYLMSGGSYWKGASLDLAVLFINFAAQDNPSPDLLYAMLIDCDKKHKGALMRGIKEQIEKAG